MKNGVTYGLQRAAYINSGHTTLTMILTALTENHPPYIDNVHITCEYQQQTSASIRRECNEHARMFGVIMKNLASYLGHVSLGNSQPPHGRGTAAR